MLKVMKRKQYWMGLGALVLSYVILNSVLQMLLGSQIGTAAAGIIFLVVSIMFQIRRLKDAGRSMWFLLMNLIPGVGVFVAIILIGCFRSKEGTTEE